MLGGDAPASGTLGQVAANVHAMPVRPEAMERLLDRRDVDGSLVQADPDLIRAAIAATRAEVRRVAAMLEHVAADPTPHERPQVAAMIAVLIYLKGVADGLERAMGDLSGRP